MNMALAEIVRIAVLVSNMANHSLYNAITLSLRHRDASGNIWVIVNNVLCPFFVIVFFLCSADIHFIVISFPCCFSRA